MCFLVIWVFLFLMSWLMDLILRVFDGCVF